MITLTCDTLWKNTELIKIEKRMVITRGWGGEITRRQGKFASWVPKFNQTRGKSFSVLSIVGSLGYSIYSIKNYMKAVCIFQGMEFLSLLTFHTLCIWILLYPYGISINNCHASAWNKLKNSLNPVLLSLCQFAALLWKASQSNLHLSEAFGPQWFVKYKSNFKCWISFLTFA